ncbi:hypothetical protein MMC13_001374 [Lambiella insularis]|nr:hypothetical protein [Lambiella insularis]
MPFPSHLVGFNAASYLYIDSQRLVVLFVAAFVLLFLTGVITINLLKPKAYKDASVCLSNFGKFFYVSFLKPHTGDKVGGQQSALESFYKAQADVYDATRTRLLRGREDMLALVATQLKYEFNTRDSAQTKPTWVDIGGGTGWNIEAMQDFLDVPGFFEHVWLVDLSPSLCEVAQKRFARLGWKNVTVTCEDARLFRLSEGQAGLVTMSYSLSMIPDFYSVVDSMTSLMASNGVLGVVDFYVQSAVETVGRNYIGGSVQRHVNWLSRSFWRAWFDLDRVGLEGAKRDYLEYRFGTLKSVDERNYILGGICIPYYIFLGKLISSTTREGDLVESLDAACTESPYLSPRQHRLDADNATKTRSKAYQSAVVNLSAKLPLPSAFYQNAFHRIFYDESHPKHSRFGNEFIYAFTWEDSRVDQRLLKIGTDDVVLCVTSAGDNLLDYLYSASPRRIHAVDMNPSQNHLLELKIAAYQALPYVDFWKLFGEGKYPAFRKTLITRLSPYLSSQACQFWLSRENVFMSRRGLYECGGSGHAIKLLRWLFWAFGLKGAVAELCEAKTLNEQREVWPKIRAVLMSRPLHWAVVGSRFLWKAAGVPPAQISMILEDHLGQDTLNPFHITLSDTMSGEAMWQYIINTLNPVARETLLSEDNFYYLLTLTGHYTRRCHPAYLSAKAHAKLSRPGAFEGLRIHTDEINEVISRIAKGSLTIAVIMDSMDWFDPKSNEALTQIRALNYALKLGGRVLLRSAGLRPWYVSGFESLGFTAKRVGARLPGTFNMYASTWVMIKSNELSVLDREVFPSGNRPRSRTLSKEASPILEKLEI